MFTKLRMIVLSWTMLNIKLILHCILLSLLDPAGNEKIERKVRMSKFYWMASLFSLMCVHGRVIRDLWQHQEGLFINKVEVKLVWHISNHLP